MAETHGLPEDFDTYTPWAKVELLGSANLDRALLTRYLALGAEINVLRAVKMTLPSVRPGVKSYWRFCALLGRPSFPPTTDTAQLWSATFWAGKTFAQYIARLQKASILLGHPLEWLTPSAKSLSEGLRNAQDLIFKFPQLY